MIWAALIGGVALVPKGFRVEFAVDQVIDRTQTIKDVGASAFQFELGETGGVTTWNYVSATGDVTWKRIIATDLLGRALGESFVQKTGPATESWSFESQGAKLIFKRDDVAQTLAAAPGQLLDWRQSKSMRATAKSGASVTSLAFDPTTPGTTAYKLSYVGRATLKIGVRTVRTEVFLRAMKGWTERIWLDGDIPVRFEDQANGAPGRVVFRATSVAAISQ